MPERLDIKIPLWGQIDEAAPADTIFATNSSSYPSRMMAEKVRDKSRLCNIHFYMPPTANAVDLMSDGETGRTVLDTLLGVLPEFGIHPFEARKESVGFIFNRVWAAIKRESLAVVAEGVARPEDVDGMFKINWHLPYGPFQMMDQVGLDVVLDSKTITPTRIRTCPPPGRGTCCARTSRRASFGIKTGEGSTRTAESRRPGERNPGRLAGSRHANPRPLPARPSTPASRLPCRIPECSFAGVPCVRFGQHGHRGAVA
ncbi:3-hydroxyacyl-CoA dehydrogenase family protein, partial [Amycolatopsis halotolerans]|uniref:3-hydroxyacyl-CoA dehydrogenase family protein n=1 Tax=Amycolatopsis halotolerans TaxID=330083 RepID=UPI00360E4F93